MVDTLSVFRHHVHGGVWTNKVVLGGKCVSKLPNYGIGLSHAGVYEYWVSGYFGDRPNVELIRDREGWNQFMHD